MTKIKFFKGIKEFIDLQNVDEEVFALYLLSSFILPKTHYLYIKGSSSTGMSRFPDLVQSSLGSVNE